MSDNRSYSSGEHPPSAEAPIPLSAFLAGRCRATDVSANLNARFPPTATATAATPITPGIVSFNNAGRKSGSGNRNDHTTRRIAGHRTESGNVVRRNDGTDLPASSTENAQHKVQKNSKDPAGEVRDQDPRPVPPTTFKLFVGNLGHEATETNLGALFRSRYPSFLSAEIPTLTHKQMSGEGEATGGQQQTMAPMIPGRPVYPSIPIGGMGAPMATAGGRPPRGQPPTRGFGFVTFSDGREMLDALNNMNGKYLGNRPIKLLRSRPESKTSALSKVCATSPHSSSITPCFL